MVRSAPSTVPTTSNSRVTSWTDSLRQPLYVFEEQRSLLQFSSGISFSFFICYCSTGLRRPAGVGAATVAATAALQIHVEPMRAEATTTTSSTTAPQIHVEPICSICHEEISCFYGTNCRHMCMCRVCAGEHRRRELQSVATPRCPICMQENESFIDGSGDEA